MKKLDKNKITIIRLIVSFILFILGLILENTIKDVSKYIWLSVYIPAYLIIGYDVLLKAIRNIKSGKIFDENFLMTIATIGAFIVGEYPEAAAVMLFYQAGELFQQFAVDKSRRSITDLMNIRPDYANVKDADGNIITVDPEEVKKDDIIVIKAGEKVPLDGIILDGSSSLDTSALTGESLPKEVYVGSEILSGSVNIFGVLTVRVTKEYSESTVAKILDLVENATSNKSQSEKFITKFAKYYTPFVVIVAALLALLPPIVTGIVSGSWYFSEWVYRALTFLVISCPCALVISIPLSFFGGIGGASKKGILIKGSNYLEALAKTEIAVFDKTGTLSKGVFKVQKILPVNLSADRLLEIAAYSESFSSHPIAVSLLEAYGKEIENGKVTEIEEIAGYGISCHYDNKKVLIGNSKLMDKYSIEYTAPNDIGTRVYVALDNVYEGCIIIADELKSDSKALISELKKIGITKTVMLTGDNKDIGNKAAAELGIDKVYTELLPDAKVEAIEKLLKEKSPKGKLIYAGDGINDAPVLARSDIGIAMGGLGSDAAIEAADMVVMTDEPLKIATAIKISKKTLRIVYENIIFSLAVKAAVLILGALGIASMWAAVFADVGVAVIAILNAIRMLNFK